MKAVQVFQLPTCCPECKSRHMVDRLGKECKVCLDCGFVISAENACKTSREQNNRKKNTSTDNALKRISAEMVASDILELWNQVKIGDATEKNIVLALNYITQFATDLSLPLEVLEKAAKLYKRIIEKNLVKGRSIKALAAVALILGCKEHEVAISTKRVANISKITPRKITRFYRVITRQLGLSSSPLGNEKYVEDLAARLHISPQTLAVIRKITNNLQSLNSFTGKDPTGIACAIIYMSSVLNGEKRTQREIAEVARITEQTIRIRCRELRQSLFFNVCI